MAKQQLTDAQVLDIRARVKNGETQRGVARLFRISVGHVNDIVHNRRRMTP